MVFVGGYSIGVGVFDLRWPVLVGYISEARFSMVAMCSPFVLIQRFQPSSLQTKAQGTIGKLESQSIQVQSFVVIT